MNVPRYAAVAAKLLAQHVAGDSPSAGERERGIETIERALQARSRRRLWWRSGAVLAAAAAVVLGWFALPRAGSEGAARGSGAAVDVSPRGRGATVRDHAGEHPLDGRAELLPDQAIETADDGGASLRLSTGTRVELAGKTSFRVEHGGPSERFALARGELSAEVVKLGPGQRFVVATPDAEIEVRGTRFRLVVLSRGEACGAGSRTRLDVSEGVVEVRSAGSSVRVGRGGRWPSDCVLRGPVQTPSVHPEPAVAPHAVAAAPTVRVAASTAGESHAPRLGNAVAPGQGDAALKRQNDLFAEAVASARRGDRVAALRAYEELIRSFPGSALAENALVERMRLVLPADPERARAEARRYLAHYPHGFAVEEAERVLGQR